MLDERRSVVLGALIEEYIGVGEPVSSRAVLDRSGLSVSSATIRNDLAALERDGYAMQPHTSAGRVPTGRAYRYYVDHLSPVALRSATRVRIHKFFDSVHTELSRLLKATTGLLSEVTHYPAIVIGPGLDGESIRGIHCVPVAPNTVMVVLVGGSGQVAQEMVSLQHPLDSAEVGQAEELLLTRTPHPHQLEASMHEDWNQAYEHRKVGFTPQLCSAVFAIAGENLADDVLFGLIQRWIQEDKLSFLAKVVNGNLSLADVADAIRRYHHLAEQEPEIQSPNKRGIEVSLIRRFLSDQLQYVSAAKGYIQVHDFYNLLDRVIFVPASHGKLGGKSAGLYLAAQILKKKAENNDLLKGVKVPKTYHLTSDLLLHFMHHNNFDEVVEQKYKPINQARFEYPHIVQSAS